MLFQRDPSFDFKGRLSFSWPATAVYSKNAEPLFKLGYGLNYKSNKTVKQLSEDSGLENAAIASTNEFYSKGAAVEPWGLWLNSGDLDKQIASYPTSVGGLLVSKTDHKAQEDAIRLKWTKSDSDQMRISSSASANLARQTTGSMELAFTAKSFGSSPKTMVKIGMCSEGTSCEQKLDIALDGNDWKEYRISLTCFANIGVVMTKINSAFIITAGEGVDVGISDVRIESDTDAKPGCDGK